MVALPLTLFSWSGPNIYQVKTSPHFPRIRQLHSSFEKNLTFRSVYFFKDKCSFFLSLSLLLSFLCRTLWALNTSTAVDWKWEYYHFVRFALSIWGFDGFCFSDLTAVQVGDTRRCYCRWTGRSDQCHPAEGHQPLWRRCRQWYLLTWVSISGAQGVGKEVNLPTTGSGSSPNTTPAYWPSHQMEGRHHTNAFWGKRCQLLVLRVCGFVSMALLTWCWQRL